MVNPRDARAAQRSDGGAQARSDGDGRDGRDRRDRLEPPGCGDSPPGDDDRKAALLQRRGAHQLRCGRGTIGVGAAPGAGREMRLEARFLELCQLAVERRREKLVDAIAGVGRNLPHWPFHFSSDALC
jgi:hypothetical protein